MGEGVEVESVGVTLYMMHHIPETEHGMGTHSGIPMVWWMCGWKMGGKVMTGGREITPPHHRRDEM